MVISSYEPSTAGSRKGNIYPESMPRVFAKEYLDGSTRTYLHRFPLPTFGSTSQLVRQRAFNLKDLVESPANSKATYDVDQLDTNWVIAHRNGTGSGVKFSMLPLSTSSNTMTSVVLNTNFYGSENSAGDHTAINIAAHQTTKKIFIMIPGATEPVFVETATCVDNTDCSCSHGCFGGYCFPVTLSTRCGDPSYPYCSITNQDCVECTLDGQCGTTGRVDTCDLDVHECGECIDDSGCSDSNMEQTIIV
jgi:hypothetical protein